MSTWSNIALRWWGQIPVYLYALACTAVCLSLWAAHGIEFDPEQTQLNFRLLYTTGTGLFFVDIVWRLYRDRPKRPLQWARDRYFTPRSLHILIAAIPLLAICTTLIPIFSSLKSMIPLFTEYTWDAAIIEFERKLFFGYDAWQILHPFIGYPIVTAAIAVAYHLWVGFLYLGVLVMALYGSVTDDLRRRFFLSYALAWSVVGGLMATLLACVGPVFAEPLVGIDTFAPQMEYLRAANEQVPVMTLRVQDMLLERFYLDERGLGSGITAMPSMHVAVAALFWLAAREISPKAGRFFFWFMVLIWIGSVHLAYHYALDGLVSLAAVFAIWKTVPFVFRAWDRVPIPMRQPALRTNTVPAE